MDPEKKAVCKTARRAHSQKVGIHAHILVIPNIFYLMGVIIILTAGRAKNEIPRRAHREAISLPFHVCGTASPYPTVQRVIWKYQSKIEKLTVEGFVPYVLFTQGR